MSNPTERRISVEKHKCNTCGKEFPACDARKIVWGIDRDPSARGADADKVLECDAYTRSMNPTSSSKGEV